MSLSIGPNTQLPIFHSFPKSHDHFCSVRVNAVMNNHCTITESSKTFYDLLGVKKNGNMNEIKRAYKQLARKYHPDVSPPDRAEEYTRVFVRVQEAYETLSDPQARAMYDSGARKSFQFDKVDWMSQLKELEKRSMNKKNPKGKNMRWTEFET